MVAAFLLLGVFGELEEALIGINATRANANDAQRVDAYQASAVQVNTQHGGNADYVQGQYASWQYQQRVGLMPAGWQRLTMFRINAC